jgi:DNA invertase Pin-like site-specific DNA recombinase
MACNDDAMLPPNLRRVLNLIDGKTDYCWKPLRRADSCDLCGARARQVSELQAYAEAKNYEVVEVCEEMISGSAEDDERHGLRRVEELARAGKIEKVLVHEISRLARRNSVAHRFVETLEECGVSLYWHAQGIETLLPNGKRNPAAGIMLALLAEMARNETETLRERINSGLAEAR